MCRDLLDSQKVASRLETDKGKLKRLALETRAHEPIEQLKKCDAKTGYAKKC